MNLYDVFMSSLLSLYLCAYFIAYMITSYVGTIVKKVRVFLLGRRDSALESYYIDSEDFSD